jgi:hypothetical protein
MHEHRTRHDSSEKKGPRAARPAPGADIGAAGNRAMSEVLAPRPVQRWPDLDGLLGDVPSMPSLPSMADLPSMPSMPSFNIPGVNLNIDTDAGTASGGIDFHNGTAAQASYGAGGLDASGQMGNSTVSGHASAADSWNVQGTSRTSGGTSLGASLSDDHGSFGGAATAAGNGERGSLAGTFGGGGPASGFGSYDGSYGNLGLGF